MAIKLMEQDGGKLVEIEVSGKLRKEDYREFVPEFERLVTSHGKLRVLFEMKDFHGWDLAALWEDIKFDLKHFSDIERVAMVGEKSWEKGMAKFCVPFTRATVRYFDQTRLADAKTWVSER